MKISSSDTIKQFNLKDSFYYLNETVEQIKKRFAETFKKLPKNNKNVENLENEISRLSNFPSIQDRIRLTIYGNKDSGKTSFINSIIGKELIPIKNHEKEENKEDKNNIKEEKKENNIPEENTKITQRIFILRNKEEETTSLCRVNLKKVIDLANDVHICYNIYGTEEIYSSEKALKYGIIGEEEIKKYLAQPLVQNNKEAVKENLENETLKEINTNPKEIPNTKENENILDYIPKNVTLLPNTSGARNAEEAVRIARLAKELGCGNFVKIEIMRDTKYLLPDNQETVKAHADGAGFVLQHLPSPHSCRTRGSIQ